MQPSRKNNHTVSTDNGAGTGIGARIKDSKASPRIPSRIPSLSRILATSPPRILATSPIPASSPLPAPESSEKSGNNGKSGNKGSSSNHGKSGKKGSSSNKGKSGHHSGSSNYASDSGKNETAKLIPAGKMEVLNSKSFSKNKGKQTQPQGKLNNRSNTSSKKRKIPFHPNLQASTQDLPKELYVVKKILNLKDKYLNYAMKNKNKRIQQNIIKDKLNLGKTLRSTTTSNMSHMARTIVQVQNQAKIDGKKEMLAYGPLFKSIGWYFMSNAIESQKRFHLEKTKQFLTLNLKLTTIPREQYAFMDQKKIDLVPVKTNNDGPPILVKTHKKDRFIKYTTDRTFQNIIINHHPLYLNSEGFKNNKIKVLLNMTIIGKTLMQLAEINNDENITQFYFLGKLTQLFDNNKNINNDILKNLRKIVLFFCSPLIEKYKIDFKKNRESKIINSYKNFIQKISVHVNKKLAETIKKVQTYLNALQTANGKKINNSSVQIFLEEIYNINNYFDHSTDELQPFEYFNKTKIESIMFKNNKISNIEKIDTEPLENALDKHIISDIEFRTVFFIESIKSKESISILNTNTELFKNMKNRDEDTINKNEILQSFKEKFLMQQLYLDCKNIISIVEKKSTDELLEIIKKGDESSIFVVPALEKTELLNDRRIMTSEHKGTYVLSNGITIDDSQLLFDLLSRKYINIKTRIDKYVTYLTQLQSLSKNRQTHIEEFLKFNPKYSNLKEKIKEFDFCISNILNFINDSNTVLLDRGFEFEKHLGGSSDKSIIYNDKNWSERFNKQKHKLIYEHFANLVNIKKDTQEFANSGFSKTNALRKFENDYKNEKMYAFLFLDFLQLVSGITDKEDDGDLYLRETFQSTFHRTFGLVFAPFLPAYDDKTSDYIPTCIPFNVVKTNVQTEFEFKISWPKQLYGSEGKGSNGMLPGEMCKSMIDNYDKKEEHLESQFKTAKSVEKYFKLRKNNRFETIETFQQLDISKEIKVGDKEDHYKELIYGFPYTLKSQLTGEKYYSGKDDKILIKGLNYNFTKGDAMKIKHWERCAPDSFKFKENKAILESSNFLFTINSPDTYKQQLMSDLKNNEKSNNTAFPTSWCTDEKFETGQTLLPSQQETGKKGKKWKKERVFIEEINEHTLSVSKDIIKYASNTAILIFPAFLWQNILILLQSFEIEKQMPYKKMHLFRNLNFIEKKNTGKYLQMIMDEFYCTNLHVMKVGEFICVFQYRPHFKGSDVLRNKLTGLKYFDSFIYIPANNKIQSNKKINFNLNGTIKKFNLITENVIKSENKHGVIYSYCSWTTKGNEKIKFSEDEWPYFLQLYKMSVRCNAKAAALHNAFKKYESNVSDINDHFKVVNLLLMKSFYGLSSILSMPRRKNIRILSKKTSKILPSRSAKKSTENTNRLMIKKYSMVVQPQSSLANRLRTKKYGMVSKPSAFPKVPKLFARQRIAPYEDYEPENPKPSAIPKVMPKIPNAKKMFAKLGQIFNPPPYVDYKGYVQSEMVRPNGSANNLT